MSEIINLEAVRHRRYCRVNNLVYARTMEVIRGVNSDAAIDALLEVVLKLLEESFDNDDEKMHHAVGLIAEHLHRSIDPEWGLPQASG
jgi:hypothetical protein